MRYVSYRLDDQDHVGILENRLITPLIGVTTIGSASTDELLAAQPDRSRSLELSEIALLPASSDPRRVLCVGLNYRTHIRETGRELPDYPVLFPKFASNLLAADAPIALPPESSQPDVEGELAVVIGRPGRRIRAEDALDHVLGYSVANDVTMRDFQYKTHQWLQGKAWDASTPLGPAIVTPDEVDLGTARLRTVLNDEIMQDAALSDLLFDVATLIEQISTFTELQAGDVVLTGTPGGVGYRRDPRVFLKPGDRVSVEIDGVGRTDNIVVAEGVST